MKESLSSGTLYGTSVEPSPRWSDDLTRLKIDRFLRHIAQLFSRRCASPLQAREYHADYSLVFFAVAGGKLDE